MIKKTSVKINHLIKQKLWLLSEGNCFRNQMINLCAFQQLTKEKEVSFEYESGSLETLIKMVDTEGGATLIPELAAIEMRKKQQSQIKDIDDHEKPLREISLAYSRSFAKKRLIRYLEKSITENLPKQMLEAKGNVLSIYLPDRE